MVLYTWQNQRMEETWKAKVCMTSAFISRDRFQTISKDLLTSSVARHHERFMQVNRSRHCKPVYLERVVSELHFQNTEALGIPFIKKIPARTRRDLLICLLTQSHIYLRLTLIQFRFAVAELSDSYLNMQKYITC